MKIPLTYGFYMALAGAVLTLLMYFAGMHDTAEKLNSSRWVGGIGGAIIGATFLVLAMREKRANTPLETDWTYGSAVGVGILTGLFGAIFSVVFTYLYFGFLNPGMSELILEAQLAAMEAKGMTSAQISNAEPMMRKMMSPVMLTVFQGFFGLVWGICLALITAIFMRSRPAGFVPNEIAPPPVS